MRKLILVLSIVSAFGQIPMPGPAPAAATGGNTGGATNLTTVGAIPYVSASGVLNQDSPGIHWDAVNNRLGLGLAAPDKALDIAESSYLGWGSTAKMTGEPGLGWGVQISNNWALIAAITTRNILIGTTTDSNFKLDVAASGSAGTFRAYDATPTTGITKTLIRAGAGQGANILMEWQNAAGVKVAELSGQAGGRFGIYDDYNNFSGLIDGGGGSRILSIFTTAGNQVVRIGGATGSANFIQSALLIGTTTDSNFKLDVAASGSAGTFRAYALGTTGSTKAVVRAGEAQAGNLMEWQNSATAAILFGITATGITQWTSIAEPTCNAANRGSVTMVQGGAGVADTYRICRKDAADAYAWTALY